MRISVPVVALGAVLVLGLAGCGFNFGVSTGGSCSAAGTFQKHKLPVFEMPELNTIKSVDIKQVTNTKEVSEAQIENIEGLWVADWESQIVAVQDAHFDTDTPPAVDTYYLITLHSTQKGVAEYSFYLYQDGGVSYLFRPYVGLWKIPAQMFDAYVGALSTDLE